MTHGVRLALTASFLLSGMLAAQEPLDPVRSAAARDAELFVSCFMIGDSECYAELNYLEPLGESGDRLRDMNTQMSALVMAKAKVVGADATATGLTAAGTNVAGLAVYFWIEVAEPWPPFAAGASLYAYVPYFASFVDPASGRRVDRMSYLIGNSADDGESWSFYPVRHELRANELDRFIPGQGEVPRPEFRDVNINEKPLERSQWLVTTFRQFVPADEAYYYVLTFAIREAFATPIDITVRYDNPANPAELASERGTLEPGKAALRWQSPPMEGFEADRAYRVVIEGRDPDTGNLLFEHREELLFPPTRERWLSDMSKPPQAGPAN